MQAKGMPFLDPRPILMQEMGTTANGMEGTRRRRVSNVCSGFFFFFLLEACFFSVIQDVPNPGTNGGVHEGPF